MDKNIRWVKLPLSWPPLPENLKVPIFQPVVKNATTETETSDNVGIKNSAGKDRWDLVPWEELEQVVKVFTHSTKKYEPDNWKTVPNAENEYFAALQRHIASWRKGEQLDKESGINHLAHAICCLLFLMWFDARMSNNPRQSGTDIQSVVTKKAD